MEPLSKNFNREEFACKCGCGFDDIDLDLIPILQAVRDHFKSPVNVHSGCRCPEYNERIGGAAKSYHMKGMACDFSVRGVPPSEVQEYLAEHDGGLGHYDSFTHVDVRDHPARW